VIHRFSHDKFAYGGLILSWSKYLVLLQRSLKNDSYKSGQ
jgi:hypothetical protein